MGTVFKKSVTRLGIMFRKVAGENTVRKELESRQIGAESLRGIPNPIGAIRADEKQIRAKR